MPFTKARWEAFSPHTDGTLYVPATAATVISGTVGASKIAAGDYAATLGNSITAVLAFPLPAILRPGEPHLEDTFPYEQYNPPTGPPYTIPGLNAQSPVPVLKGIQLISVDLIYLVGTDALTSNEAGIFVKQDVNGASPNVTTLVALAANGLATAASSDRYVTNIAVPSSERNFIVTPDSVLTVEWDLETPSGGTADVFGVVFNFFFNYE